MYLVSNFDVLLPSLFSKKSQTVHIERNAKTEYLIALATYLGVRW